MHILADVGPDGTRTEPASLTGGMKSITYTETGPSSVLQLVEREAPEPGAGEVRVRVVA